MNETEEALLIAAEVASLRRARIAASRGDDVDRALALKAGLMAGNLRIVANNPEAVIMSESGILSLRPGWIADVNPLNGRVVYRKGDWLEIFSRSLPSEIRFRGALLVDSSETRNENF